MNFPFTVIICLAVISLAWIIWEVCQAPAYIDAPCAADNPPDCCDLVDVSEIEPPHDPTRTASVLKREYLEAEAALVEAHPAMADQIRRSMAECLIQGWPLDIAICQAAYSFVHGACQCATCRSLIESHP